MIAQNVYGYDFNGLIDQEIINYVYNECGFILKIKLKEIPKDYKQVVKIPNTLSISVDWINAADEAVRTDKFIKSECYLQYVDENSNCPIMQVELNFHCEEHPDWKTIKLGIPLTLYDVTKKPLYIYYNEVEFRLVYDNKIVNEDHPFGTLCMPNGDDIFVDNSFVEYAKYSNDMSLAKFTVNKNTVKGNLNYYSPFGYNMCVGDVSNFYHDGTYHLLYMTDSHHHGNRFGCGAHHLEHIKTQDFINWEDCGAIWDLSKQWHSTGTGTMFFHDGKYYVAYGLHTDRTISKDKVFRAYKEIMAYYNEHGETKSVTFDEIFEEGKYPSGATYSYSDDGVTFKSSNIVFNRHGNPSIYLQDDKLVMYGGGEIWQADNINGPWKMLAKDCPPCYKNESMRNSDECPSYFEWNGYKYIIMGVTGFWRTEKNDDTFFDSAAIGYDIYDGLAVPMAAKINNNRVVMAGWLSGIGWASVVVHRELVQKQNGVLGSKWISEMFPETHHIKSFCNDAKLDYDFPKFKSSYYIELKVNPDKDSKFAVRFTDKSGVSCELQLDFKQKLAQYSTIKQTEDSFSDTILPIHKAINTVEQTNIGWQLQPQNLHFRSLDFSIANVDYKDSNTLRILVCYSKKCNSTIVDAEINGCRTIISNRYDFFPTKMSTLTEKNTIVEDINIFDANI